MPVRAWIKERIGDLLLIETELGQVSVIPAASICDFLEKVNLALEGDWAERCRARGSTKKKR